MSPYLAAIFSIFALWIIKNVFHSLRNVATLKKLPCSPRTRFFFGNALDFLSVGRGKMSMVFIRLIYPLAKANSIVCFWMFWFPRVLIVKAKAAEEVLSSNSLLEKASFYNLLHPWLGRGLLTSTDQQWRSHRKLLTPSFHFRILDNFLPIFNEQSAILVHKLKEQVDKGVFNIYPYITNCALDIISETAMGTKIHAQSGMNREYVNAISSMGEIILMRNIKVWLLNPFIFALSHYGRMHKKCIAILHKFTNDVISARRKEYESEGRPVLKEGQDYAMGQKRRLAFLDTLLEASDNFKNLSLTEIREEVDTFMFEGHDTTSIGIGWVLHHLGWLPSIQDKVHEELDAIFGDSDREIALDDLREMKYLGATIKESLRTTPSVPLFGRRVKQDMKICGLKIPAGTDILISPNLIAADEDIFKNPLAFNPDRFLNEEWLHRHPYAFVAFSAGPRNCIGQKFALMEEKVVISTILRKFRIKTHVSVDLTEVVPDMVLRPLNGFRLELMSRTQKNNNILKA